MRTKIEIYRGYDIVFNHDTEEFECKEIGEGFKGRASFSACKKAIDDYLKSNEEFKPFEVERRVGADICIDTITGIRKDGDYTTNKGERLTKYDMRNYFLRNPDNDPIREKMREIDAKKKVLQKEYDSLQDSLSGTLLKDYRP
jgi:hypothetical protein